MHPDGVAVDDFDFGGSERLGRRGGDDAQRRRGSRHSSGTDPGRFSPRRPRGISGDFLRLDTDLVQPFADSFVIQKRVNPSIA